MQYVGANVDTAYMMNANMANTTANSHVEGDFMPSTSEIFGASSAA